MFWSNYCGKKISKIYIITMTSFVNPNIIANICRLKKLSMQKKIKKNFNLITDNEINLIWDKRRNFD